MLTYQTPSANDKVNTYWLSTAIHFARSARADHYTVMEAADGSVLKRLWWSCILRDRIMALGLHRPLFIRPADFDFTLAGLTEADFADEIRNSKVYNAPTKRILVQLAVSLCELGLVLNDILDIIYPLKVASTLNCSQQSQKTLHSALASLNRWYEKTVAKFLIPTHIFGAHRSLILFTNMVYIYYL